MLHLHLDELVHFLAECKVYSLELTAAFCRLWKNPGSVASFVSEVLARKVDCSSLAEMTEVLQRPKSMTINCHKPRPVEKEWSLPCIFAIPSSSPNFKRIL
jgi:hypothetical protein